MQLVGSPDAQIVGRKNSNSQSPKPAIPHFQSVVNKMNKNISPSIQNFKTLKKTNISSSVSPQKLIKEPSFKSMHMLRHLGNYALNQTSQYISGVQYLQNQQDHMESKASFSFKGDGLIRRKNRVQSKYKQAADQYVENSLRKWQNFPQKANTLEDMTFTSTDYKLMMSLRPSRVQQTNFQKLQNKQKTGGEQDEEPKQNGITSPNPPSFFDKDEEKWKKRWQVIEEKPKKGGGTNAGLIRLPQLKTKQRTMRTIDCVVEGNSGIVRENLISKLLLQLGRSSGQKKARRCNKQRHDKFLNRIKKLSESHPWQNEVKIRLETNIIFQAWNTILLYDSKNIKGEKGGNKLPAVSKSLQIQSRVQTPKIKEKQYDDNFKNVAGVRHLFTSYQQINQMHWGNSLREYKYKKAKKNTGELIKSAL